MQIYADVCNRPMKISRSAQTCALGAAIAGSVVAGRKAGGHATVQAAQKAGIPVVIIDSDIADPDSYISFVATDNTKGGMMGAQRLAEDFFGLAERIDIGGVEEIHARVDADFDEAARLFHLHIAHGAKASLTAEGHSAHAQRGNFQAARAQQTILHSWSPFLTHCLLVKLLESQV